MRKTVYSGFDLAQNLSHTYAPASEAILSQLREAGIDAGILRDNWQVILWSVKVKGVEVKLKLHSWGLVDESGLRRYFQAALGQNVQVCLKFKPLSKCCQSACEGCLFGNAAKKSEWVDVALQE